MSEQSAAPEKPVDERLKNIVLSERQPLAGLNLKDFAAICAALPGSFRAYRFILAGRGDRLSYHSFFDW